MSFPTSIIVRRVEAAGCNTVHVEWKYEDRRPERLFDGFVHRRYRSELLSARLHFYEVRNETRHYFGAVVIRPVHLTARAMGRSRLKLGPLRLGHVGRSLLVMPEAPQVFCGRLPRSKHGRSEDVYRLGTRHVTVSLGVAQTLTTFEYQQQSRVAGTCGHAALAMVTGYLSRTLRTRRLSEQDVQRAISRSPAESESFVDNLADETLARAIESKGAGVRLYSASYFPRRGRRIPDFRKLAEIVHLAIDSDLPCILVLGPRPGGHERHVVVAVGHTSDEKRVREDHVISVEVPEQRGRRASLTSGTPGGLGDKDAMRPDDTDAEGVDNGSVERSNTLTRTAWVRDLLVHDDAIGPYLRLPMWSRHHYPVPSTKRVSSAPEFYGEPVENLDEVWDRSVERDLQSVVFPLPRGVTTDPADAIELMPSAVRAFAEVCRSEAEQTGREIPREVQSVLDGRHLLSVFLDHGNRLRLRILDGLQDSDDASQEADLIASLHFPEHVYAVSIYDESPSDDVSAVEFALPLIGYVVLDATATADSTEVVLLARLGKMATFYCPISGKRHIVEVPFAARRALGIHRHPDPLES